MRWVPLVIFSYLFVVLQSTLGRILTLDRLAMGAVGPDFLALMAVFLALQVRSASEAMIGGWVLGMWLDVYTAGGAGPATVIGPMSIAYAVGVGLVFRIREALFRDRAIPQMLLAVFFVFFCHGLWVTVQTIAAGQLGWGGYGHLLLRVLLSAVYSALLMPLVYMLLMSCRSWLISSPPQGRGSRRGRS